MEKILNCLFQFKKKQTKIALLIITLALFMVPGSFDRLQAAVRANPAPAQQPATNIKGIVTDMGEMPLPGAYVTVKGGKGGTITDANGNFSIDVPSLKATLKVTFIGMIPQEVPVDGKTNLTIVLEEDATLLDEVVATGYQSTHKRNLTSSVSSVSSEQLSSIPVASVSSLLAGQAAGVQSVISSGAPGARGAVVIRGNTSVSGQLDPNTAYSNPLYVVDGVQTSLEDLAGYNQSNTDFLASLNPEDIESIDILKDASAAAIYGSRGANGVIIIKTKKGKIGKPEFNFSAYQGITQKPQLLQTLVGSAERQKKMDLIDQWWSYKDMANRIPILLTDSLNPAFNNNNDYQGMFYQPGTVSSYDFNMTGGTENSNYRIGLGYFSEEGIVKATGFDRFSLNINLSTKVGKAFRNQTIVRASTTDTKTGQGDGNPRNTLPMSPADMNSSLFYLSETQRQALVGQLDELYNKNRGLETTLSNFANLDILPGLALNSQIALSYSNNKTDYFQPSSVRNDGLGYAKYNFDSRKNIAVETYLSYTKNLNKIHDFNALLGNSIDYNKYDYLSLSATGGSGDAIKTIKGYTKESINGYSDLSSNAMLSYWSRFGYRLKDRYMLDLNYRRDASSRFGQDVRWGNFPSAAVAWIVSDEPWIKARTGKWLDMAKFKFSYGINGKQFSDNFLRYNVYQNYGLPLWSNQMSVNTYNGVVASGPDFGKIANDKLSWEQSKQWDFGTEVDMFGHRLTVTFDVYNKLTDKLLFDVEFPKYSGYSTAKANVAGILNYGYELRINGHLFPRDAKFRWELDLHLNRNWNYVSALPNGNRDYTNTDYGYGYTVGEPLNQFRLFRYEGVLDDVSTLPINPYTGQALGGKSAWAKLQPGFPMWTDLNGNYLISDERDEDLQTVPEYSGNPKLMGALNSTMLYKGWGLTINTSFIFGRDIFNKTLQNYLARFDLEGWGWNEKGLIDVSKYDFWQKAGDGISGSNVRFPALRPVGGSMPTYYAFRDVSTMWLEDGSYFKINLATLFYNFDENKFIKNLYLKRLRLYTTVYNPWQWQKSNVVDASMVDAQGYDYGDGYPQPRKYIFGINFRF
jgi:TonB-dependent starch-binding outer membrane protein SusC